MPDLLKSLQGRDLGHLFIVAELWGVELSPMEERKNLDVRRALQALAPALLDPSAVEEMVDSLAGETRAALDDLVKNAGRLPWQLFTRRYGMVREMGAGRRDRDRPYLAPVSPAEVLWYRALLARSFFDTPDGPEEFAYIPDDLLPLLPVSTPASLTPLGRLASPGERAYPIPASDRILDHACTYLAGLRLGFTEEELVEMIARWQSPACVSRIAPLSGEALQGLLRAADLLDEDGSPRPEPVRTFLEMQRGEALAKLAAAWLETSALNELLLLPGLSFEGDWKTDPLRTRKVVLDFLARVPGYGDPGERPYWSLSAFVTAVRDRFPDFQRPAGDYDSWFIRETQTGEFLRGFEHWEQVEGALLLFMIAGPLHWLGILDLAVSAPPQEPAARLTAFRFSDWAAALLNGRSPEGLPNEEENIQVRSDARLVVPRLAPRALRYQLARFSQWVKEDEDRYQYLLTPSSLSRARQQGLTPNHLLSLLQRHARTVPPSVVRAVDRWDRLGSQARVEQVTILRLSSPDQLQELRTSRAARFLGDPLGPTTVIVKPGAVEKVLRTLAEMGYLGEIVSEE